MAPMNANRLARCVPGPSHALVMAQQSFDFELCIGHAAPSPCAIGHASPGSGSTGSASWQASFFSLAAASVDVRDAAVLRHERRQRRRLAVQPERSQRAHAAADGFMEPSVAQTTRSEREPQGRAARSAARPDVYECLRCRPPARPGKRDAIEVVDIRDLGVEQVEHVQRQLQPRRKSIADVAIPDRRGAATSRWHLRSAAAARNGAGAGCRSRRRVRAA